MKTLIFKTFCIIALCGVPLCGIIRAEEYTVDPMLEPDPIPRFNPANEITAPARILPSEKPEYDENSLVLPGDTDPTATVDSERLRATDSGAVCFQGSEQRPNSEQSGKRPTASGCSGECQKPA